MEQPEADGVLSAADQSYRQWRQIPAPERCAAMAGLAEKMREFADEGADLMKREMGKPLSQGKAEVLKCAMLVDWYAKHGPDILKDQQSPTLPGFQKSYVSYQPLGVILSIMPWNFPLWQVVRMAVPTMMAGNAVVLKHAPSCFTSALKLEEILRTLPIPPNLFRAANVDVPVVTRMLENRIVRGVAFTGSELAGRKVAVQAASLLKKSVVELGGSDAYCVLDDADLDVAATAVVNGRILNTGQVCAAPKRAIVDKKVKADFERLVLEKLQAKTYGTDYGPLASTMARQGVAQQVEASVKSGAKLLMGGDAAPTPEGETGGCFYAPTVLTDVTPGMAGFDQEIFGPVVCIIEAQDTDHAVKLANQSDFGLGGAVFTKDLEKGERMAVNDIESGMCYVNAMIRSDPSLPFGGVKNSGLGRECSVFGMREFCNIKTICVK